MHQLREVNVGVDLCVLDRRRGCPLCQPPFLLFEADHGSDEIDYCESDLIVSEH
jgi:hypothetical protein